MLRSTVGDGISVAVAKLAIPPLDFVRQPVHGLDEHLDLLGQELHRLMKFRNFGIGASHHSAPFCSKIQVWARSETLATSGRSSRPKLVESFHCSPSL